MKKPVTANEFVEQKLHESLRAIEDAFSCHALSFSGPLLQRVDDLIRASVENKSAERPRSRKLVIILTTTGGYLEPVQRMVATIRRHYRVVDFVIPNYAYSAGTVFALSGDAIHMDYYSRLGPIDPQIRSSRGRMVSALGHLEKYNELIAKAQAGTISAAEVQLLIDGFDQAELYSYEQAKQLSIASLEEWLVKYKFKNWKKTASRKLPVTLQMKKSRAQEIGNQLNDTKKWHSHGYGISMEVLRKDLRLEIDDFGANDKVSSVIRPYYDLLTDYMERRGTEGVIHTCGAYRPFM
jgi:hypothetical protein